MGLGENYLKRLNCEHKNEMCVSNYYGDCITFYAFGNRSAWFCKDCGKVSFKPELEQSCKIVNFTF